MRQDLANCSATSLCRVQREGHPVLTKLLQGLLGFLDSSPQFTSDVVFAAVGRPGELCSIHLVGVNPGAG